MKELIKKIAEAKKEIGKISKDSTNPFFKSKYFDINQLLEHIEPVLEKHGLVVLQPIADNKVYSTIYDIETGVAVDSFMELTDIKDPQKRGSEITYYRRYTLTSLLSLQAEDDDANKASNKKQEKELQWLNADKIDAAVEYLKSNNLKADDVRKFYKISKDNFEILTKKMQ